MAKDPLSKFKNEARLLSEDEQELIGVLSSFYEAIEDLRNRQKALEATLELALPALVRSRNTTKMNDG